MQHVQTRFRILKHRLPDTSLFVWVWSDSNHLSPLGTVQQFTEGQHGGTSPALFPQRVQHTRLAQFAQKWQRGLFRDAGALHKIAGLKNRAIKQSIQHRDGVLRSGQLGDLLLHALVQRQNAAHPLGVGLRLLG